MADGNMQSAMIDIRQIADALRITKRGAELRAGKEDWPFTAQAVRGGQRRLFQTSALPSDVQAAVRLAASVAAAQNATPTFVEGQRLGRRLTITDSIDAAVQKRDRECGTASAAGLTGTRKARMEAKLELLQRLAAFAKSHGLGICASMQDFCAAYNSGALTVPVTVRQHTGAALSASTLMRWRKLLKTKGPAALAGNYGNRINSGAIESNCPLREFAIGLIAEKPHISAKLLHLAIEARFNAAPDLRSVQRFMAKWKHDNAEAFLALTNPDAWKNRHMAAFGSLTENITRACQLWQMDSSPADLQLVDGRYSLVAVIDLGWRGLRLHVTKNSNAEAVCQVMRRAIIEWGVPEAIKVDNGQDYASNRVANLATAIGSELRFSAPFSPWEKGNVERAFRSFSHSLLELLPGYTGHNVAEAQEIRAREAFSDRLFKKNAVVELKLTAAELQKFCDQWCENYYAHESHQGLDGETPFQRYSKLRDVVRRIGDVRALDLLLGEGDLRTVSKKGLRLGKLVYIAPELSSVIGQHVLVRQDDADIGRAVVYHEEKFLCIAECPEVSGVSRQEIAIEAKSQQTKRIQDAKAELKAAKRKANTRDIAWEILDRKAEQNAALTTLPAPNVIHLTPALEAAAEAADALDAEQSTQPAIAPSTIADVDDVTHLLQREQAQDDTADLRFAWALGVLMTAPEERDDIQRHRLKSYVNSDEFKGRWLVFEYFGPESKGLPSEYAALLPDGTARERLIHAQQGD